MTFLDHLKPSLEESRASACSLDLTCRGSRDRTWLDQDDRVCLYVMPGRNHSADCHDDARILSIRVDLAHHDQALLTRYFNRESSTGTRLEHRVASFDGLFYILRVKIATSDNDYL